MTACALHLHPKKCSAKNLSLCSHRNIIVRCHCKTRTTSKINVATHKNQLRDKPIHRFIILKCIVNKESKGACVIQSRFKNIGIFSEHILPITYPMVRIPWIAQKPVNHFASFRCALIRDKIANIIGGRWNTDGV